MIGKTVALAAMAGAMLATGLGAPAAAHAKPADGKPLPPLASNKCDPLLAKVLPGEFNFCLATQYWREGKTADAAEMLQLAASWGNKGAQTALGVAYFNGEGVAQDRALGLAWLALAAERHAPTASGLFVSARNRVDEAEYARAVELYGQMRTRYADEIAAVRADSRYRRAVHALEGDPTYGVGRCIDGFNHFAFSRATDPDQNVDKPKPCSQASERIALQALEERYEVAAEGWNGHVKVGPAQSLGAVVIP